MDAYRFNANASFNPFEQNFLILAPDGHTKVLANIQDVFMVQTTATNLCITMGAQIGAAIVLLLTLMLTTKSEKRRSAVFILNCLSLLFVALRGLFSICMTKGPLYNFYRYETGFYQDLSHAKGISSTTEVMSFLLTSSIMLALVMQVRIVCCNLRTWHRRFINLANAGIVFVAVGIRFALMVTNINWNIVHLEVETQSQFNIIAAVGKASNFTLVACIGISSIIFCTKLGIAIKRRYDLGMRQFGPMQIIFVMGLQTMSLPFIFTAVVYGAMPHGQVTSFVPVSVALTLPLSAMWASANTSTSQIATPHSKPGAIPVGNPNMSSDRRSEEKIDRTYRTDSTLVDNSSTGSDCQCKAATPVYDNRGSDLEMGEYGKRRGLGAGTVYVDRSYSVRSG